MKKIENNVKFVFFCHAALFDRILAFSAWLDKILAYSALLDKTMEHFFYWCLAHSAWLDPTIFIFTADSPFNHSIAKDGRDIGMGQ